MRGNKFKSWLIISFLFLTVILISAIYWLKFNPVKITDDVFKNATYQITFVDNNKTIKFNMKNGESDELENHAFCFSPSMSTTNSRNKTGVVEVDCNYGTSRTDVFLVAFKNLNRIPVQTDEVDLRENPTLKTLDPWDLWRVGVDDMTLDNNGLIKVTAMVVPESQRDLSGAEKYATKPIPVSYHLDNHGKFQN